MLLWSGYLEDGIRTIRLRESQSINLRDIDVSMCFRIRRERFHFERSRID